MTDHERYTRPAVAGSGTIACSVAACASALGEVRLLARSDASAWQGEERAQTYCSKVEGGAPDRIRVTTDANDLAGCDLVVEAVIEDMEAKIDLLHELGKNKRFEHWIEDRTVVRDGSRSRSQHFSKQILSDW